MQTLMQTLGQINMVELDGRSETMDPVMTQWKHVETIQLEMLQSLQCTILSS